MFKFCFTRNMGFGEWLRGNRKAAKLSQVQLAARATDQGFPVTDAYVSMIEREYDKNKKGQPTRVNQDLVVAFAKALGVPIDEALLAAGYAPTQQTTRPRTIPELIAALERLGIESPQMYGGLPDDPDGERCEFGSGEHAGSVLSYGVNESVTFILNRDTFEVLSNAKTVELQLGPYEGFIDAENIAKLKAYFALGTIPRSPE